MYKYQPDFFEETSDFDLIENRISKMEKTHDKVRKRLFADQATIGKAYFDLLDRVEVLEREIAMLRKN